jgi:hypothetical protein
MGEPPRLLEGKLFISIFVGTKLRSLNFHSFLFLEDWANFNDSLVKICLLDPFLENLESFEKSGSTCCSQYVIFFDLYEDKRNIQGNKQKKLFPVFKSEFTKMCSKFKPNRQKMWFLNWSIYVDPDTQIERPILR